MAQSKAFQSLQIGESVIGRVEEILASAELLISIDGFLLRVRNETGRKFTTGNSVILIVKAVNPIRFQMQPPRPEQKLRGKFNVSV